MEPETSKKNNLLVLVIVIVIVIVAIGYFFYFGSYAEKKALLNPLKLENAVLLEQQELSHEQAISVAKQKTTILRRVADTAPLTEEERTAIGNIMLTQSHIYKFTQEERDAIFEALRK